MILVVLLVLFAIAESVEVGENEPLWIENVIPSSPGPHGTKDTHEYVCRDCDEDDDEVDDEDDDEDDEPQPFEITLSATACEYIPAERMPCITSRGCGGDWIEGWLYDDGIGDYASPYREERRRGRPVKVVPVGMRTDYAWNEYEDRTTHENALNLMFSLVMSELDGITFVTYRKREYDLEDIYWRNEIYDYYTIRKCDVHKVIVRHTKNGRIPLLIDRFDMLMRKYGDMLEGRICEDIARVTLEIKYDGDRNEYGMLVAKMQLFLTHFNLVIEDIKET